VTVDVLKSFRLLTELNDEDRMALSDLLDEKSVAEGRRIFSEGTEAEGLILVASGSVRIQSKRTGLEEIFEAPVALGALSLVSVGPRECTAIAASACAVLTLARTAYRRLVEDHPRTACRLTEGMIEEASALIRGGLDKLADA
jgi:CRP-like cAMP-binding protein